MTETPKKVRPYAHLPKKLRQLRAAKMAERKILHNMSNVQVAKEFGVTPHTVAKALKIADRADIVVKFEDKLYTELLPDSFNAVQEALQGTGEVARAKIGLAVLQGTQVLRPNAQRSAVHAAEDDELALYVLKKRKMAELEDNTHEGNIIGEAVTPGLEGSGHESLLLGAGSGETAPGGQAENGETGPKTPKIEDSTQES